MTTTTDRASSIFFPPRGAGSETEPGRGTLPTARPEGPSYPPATVVVTVIGPAGGIAALADQLPDNWQVRTAALGEVGETDLLVISAATGGRIAAAVRLHRGIPVVGIVDAFAPAEQVVEVLEAGADACVRSGQPALVGSHLRACYRRRMLAA